MTRSVLFALLLLVAPHATPRQPPRPAPPLEIAVEDAADPWSRADGTGFANDVVRAAYRAMNVDVHLMVVPYARCKEMVVEGAVVACFSMSPAPDLQGAVRFPATPLLRCYTELVQNPAQPLGASRLRDLPAGTVVGSVLGYEYPAEVRQAVRAGRIVLDASPSEEILLRKLTTSRLHAALVNVSDSKPLEYIAAMAGVAAKIQVAGRVGALESYIGFSVRNPRGASARATYDQGMHRITANGELARIVAGWADSSRVAILALHGGRRGRP